jgi:hypothetical protein
MANKGNYLKVGQYLNVGDYLVSNEGSFFMIMQVDGTLAVYRGTGPNDNKGLIWGSNADPQGLGDHFAIMQVDGTLAVYKGGLNDNHGYIWVSPGAPGGYLDCFAIMQSNGQIAVYRGTGPNDNQGFVWASSVNPYLNWWMEINGPVIGHLSLDKLTLVCSHDSGTYSMNSPLCIPWASCQNLDINNQLKQGVRVLDLRIGIQRDKSGDNRFILIHNNWNTKVTLKNALEQVKSFLNENAREVVILDFHQFGPQEGNNFDLADEDCLAHFVYDNLGDLIYPNPNKIPTLNEIWNTSHRIIVTWNSNNSYPGFFKGIWQLWFNKNNLDDLYSSISDEMKYDHQNNGFWSICAIITPTDFFPLHSISPDVEKWFQAGCEWAQKANIIAVDFVEKTSIVQQAISECLNKGVTKE